MVARWEPVVGTPWEYEDDQFAVSESDHNGNDVDWWVGIVNDEITMAQRVGFRSSWNTWLRGSLVQNRT